ncbi:IS630 transposase-related protein [Moraxella sp. K127]|uniref:IS630 transposase-related protein n=1 Tax=Moraxella sp. K127 TaxID=2780079 RepID=UPI00351BFA7A
MEIKPTKDVKPKKIDDEALLKDVEDYPYDYLYERARRFGCTDMGIYKALKDWALLVKKQKSTP